MANKASSTVIGAFVLGAMGLALAGIILLGSGRIFERRTQYVLFFANSLGGLDVGAPVEFSGVRVGTVRDIRLVVDNRTTSVRAPVIIDLEPDRWDESGEMRVSRWVEKRGLRASLASQSMLTGKLKIELSLLPEREAVYRNNGCSPLPEIPTVSSGFDAIAEKVKNLPLEEIVMQLRDAIIEVRNLLGSGEMSAAIQSADGTMKDAQKLIRSVNESYPALKEDVETLMDELTRTSRALRSLADSLERNPESVLHGKPEEK